MADRPPLEYATPIGRTPFWRRPWTRRKKIIAAIVILVAGFILFHVVVMCAMVVSGLSDPR